MSTVSPSPFRSEPIDYTTEVLHTVPDGERYETRSIGQGFADPEWPSDDDAQAADDEAAMTEADYLLWLDECERQTALAEQPMEDGLPADPLPPAPAMSGFEAWKMMKEGKLTVTSYSYFQERETAERLGWNLFMLRSSTGHVMYVAAPHAVAAYGFARDGGWSGVAGTVRVVLIDPGVTFAPHAA